MVEIKVVFLSCSYILVWSYHVIIIYVGKISKNYQPRDRYPGTCRLLYKEDLIKDKKSDDHPGCNIQMDVNLCIWSQTPCRFKPYLPLRPHMKHMGPHFMTAQLCSVGFSVHTNIPSMQPMQQLN